MTMAELLAKQSASWRIKPLSRGQEIEGTIITILADELILDLGSKAEGVIPKKDFPSEQLEKLKVGDKLSAFVIFPENDSGQVVLGLERVFNRGSTNSARFSRFETSQKSDQILTGKVLETNRGGLVVEVGGVRGFLPTSQIALSLVNNFEDLVGSEIKIKVIEVDSSQNRLIFTQIIELSADLKAKLATLKTGDIVEGKISSILNFGIVVKLEIGLEGFVHISESSWDQVEDPNSLFKVGDQVKAKVLSIDTASFRINLSIKQLQDDPFKALVEKYKSDDVVKGEVVKVDEKGVNLRLDAGAEGFIPSNKLEKDIQYVPGTKLSCIVDSVDTQRRRVVLAPFITSTKDLIYK